MDALNILMLLAVNLDYNLITFPKNLKTHLPPALETYDCSPITNICHSLQIDALKIVLFHYINNKKINKIDCVKMIIKP